MDPLFQNCVTEFDLNFLDQTTNANQASRTEQNPIARKNVFGRLKHRVKVLSQVVHKAKFTEHLLLRIEKELLENKQDLQETRNLLFGTNEENKVLSEERSAYFNQLTECQTKLQEATEQIAQFKKMNFDTKMKDQIIQGYSNEVAVLHADQTKNADVIKQLVKKLNMVEKTFEKVVIHYALSSKETKAKPPPWLKRIVKKYVPLMKFDSGNADLPEDNNEKDLISLKRSNKEEDSQKIRKCSVETELGQHEHEIALEDFESPTDHRHMSLDFDFVGSVDTGRGSSPALSDGEKSFHSPDYFMNDSPPCAVSNLCSNLKTDVSTSPIPQEISDIGNSFARNACPVLPKTDACTSPMRSQRFDVATDTADIFYENDTYRNKKDAGSSRKKLFNDTSVPSFSITNQTCTEPRHESILKETSVSSIESGTIPLMRQDTTSSIEPINNINSENNAVKTTHSAIDYDDTENHHLSSLIEDPSEDKELNNVMFDDEKALSDNSGSSSPVDDLTIVSPIDFDENITNFNNNQSIELFKTSTEQLNATSDSKVNICKSKQEKKCLELNNSDNLCNGSSTDSEIQTILDKMRLRHRLLTPIPKTPSRGSIRSPGLTFGNHSAVHESEKLLGTEEQLDEDANEDLKLLQLRIQNAWMPHVQKLSEKFARELTQLLKNAEINQELLMNIISLPNSYKNRQSPHVNIPEVSHHNRKNKSKKETETQVDNLNTASITNTTTSKNIANENEDCTSDDDVDMYLVDSADLEQISEEKCKKHSELTRIKEKKKITFVPKAEEFVLSQYLKPANYTHNNNSNGCTSHEDMQEPLPNNDSDMNSSTSTQASAYLDTTSRPNSSLERRNNIIYESDDCASDVDGDMRQNLRRADLKEIKNNTDKNELSNQTITTKPKKNKKLTKLEKMRIKMVPKGKIRDKQTVKKPRFKPSPIIIPQSIPKKTVTESDSAASLNDKAVYENAVKVIAASKYKLEKEPIIIIEDCALSIQNISPKTTRNSITKEENNSCKPHSPTEASNKIHNITQKSLSESDGDPVTANHSKDNETKNCKRKRITICSDDEDAVPLKQLKKNINNIKGNKLETVESRRNSSHALNKSVSESICTKRVNDSNESHITDTKLLKQSSISACQSPHINTKSNSSVTDSIYAKSQSSPSKPKFTDCETNAKKLLNISTRQSKDIDIDNTDLSSASAKNTDLSNKSNTKAKPTMFKDSTDVSVSPQRVLRSSFAKQTKDGGCEKIPTATSKKIDSSPIELHSKNQMQLKQNDITPERNLRKSPNSIQCNQIEPVKPTLAEQDSQKNHDGIVTYADLSMFTNEDIEQKETKKRRGADNVDTYGNNLLCRMIEKHGVNKIQYVPKKIPDIKINEVCSKLESSLSGIVALPHQQSLSAMKELVGDLRKFDVKDFIAGLIKYWKNPQRKIELFKKVSCPPAPSMTCKEQVLLYVIDELQNSCEYRHIVKNILMNIEYALFALNKTPEEIDVIETMSHFYALVCRSYQKLSKLRLFIIDAMYCLQYKSIVLIKQCLEVWMLALPLGHLGLAKTPLVACLVYLLHFYKCEDKFDRIQDMRNILRRKYNYDLTDWNEPKILELFRNAIIEIREVSIEKKMLRLALIILAKRHGPTWCQNNIVKKTLQPIIKDNASSDLAKRFCVSLLGPLLKPYPNNMKVHCEMITDYLLDMLEKNNSPKMVEAIITSLLCMNKQNNRLNRFLMEWDPKTVSPEFEMVFKDYVRSKPVKKWISILSSST